MPAIQNIDIRGVDWPICILNCKKKVDQMRAGERIDILTDDIDVVNNLVILIERSPNHRIKKRTEHQFYRIIINQNSRAIPTDDR